MSGKYQFMVVTSAHPEVDAWSLRTASTTPSSARQMSESQSASASSAFCRNTVKFRPSTAPTSAIGPSSSRSLNVGTPVRLERFGEK